jgi:hypothetical protein
MTSSSNTTVSNNIFTAPAKPGNFDCFDKLETSDDRLRRNGGMPGDLEKNSTNASSKSGGSGSGDFLGNIFKAIIPVALNFFTGGSSGLVAGAMGLLGMNNDKKA